MTDHTAPVRRLAALLVGDAHGFTQHMSRDDEAAVSMITACRDAVHACVEKAGGRVIDDVGDHFLAEFGNAVDALRCGLAVHEDLCAIAGGNSEDANLRWKLVVHVGEVLSQGQRLYGTGLYIAFRLLGLARPGGVVVSEAAYDQVHRHIDLPVTDLGAQKLPGLPRRVRAYQLETGFEIDTEEGTKVVRRLAAVLNADIFGFSRLLASDQDAAVRAVRDYRDAIHRSVEAHRGAVADFTGDNFLAEFRTCLESVQCALAIQAELAVRNAERPENERVMFRIGVHLGDLRADGALLYGNAINIAARLEGLCEPGGICLSGIVREQLRGTLDLDLDLEDLGEQSLKNIPDEVRAYRIRPQG